MTTTPTSGAADLPAMVSKALREAYNLGQRYWQQADSEYISQHKKAGDTRAKFLALVEETCAALAAGQATAAQPAPAARPAQEAEPLLDYAMQIAHERELRVTGFPHDEDGAKRVFEAAVMRHTATGAAQAASVQEDAARLDFIQECGATVEILPGRLGWTFRVGGLHGGVHGSVRAAIDAERQEFRVHGRPELHAAHTLRASHGQAPASVLHLVHSAFAEIAMAFPKAFALHKVGIADTAVREALAAPARKQGGA